MAAGVPVVATRVGGNPELVGNNNDRGLLVPARDDEAIADATASLLNNPARRAELGANAQRFARERFGAASITRKFEDLYTELLSRKTGVTGSVRRGGPVKDRLKVAVVGPSLHYVGGQSVQADLLLRHWKDDPDVQASFIPVDPPFPAGLRWVARVPALRTAVRTPFYLGGLWRGLRDADVAHIFSASYSSFVVAVFPAWLVATLRGKKTLINYHSGEARDHLRGSWLARSVLKRAGGVITPSAYLVDVFREFGMRATPVANIVDLSQFSYRTRQPLRPHLVCTRGFHRYYCIDVVVKAFAKVKREYPDAQLDLVGGGPLETEIRRLVSELKLTGVNFCGLASREEIWKYYDRADIFINGSRLDNMPVSVLEAFASGTPVISTSPEGMQYLVEHGRTGMLSEVGAPEALADNVVRVLRDPELARRLSMNAAEELRRYRWATVRENWLAAYRGLVSGQATVAARTAAKV
jgi:glycosyltransferase involved in cell wall biosynthesis